jgi:hypothetical protein
MNYEKIHILVVDDESVKEMNSYYFVIATQFIVVMNI